MKKTRILLPLAMLGLLFGVAACGGSPSNDQDQSGQQSQVPGKEEKIKIEAEGGKTKLILGQSVQLTASVQGVAWASSDATVASVSVTGLVESKAVGKTTITASKEGYKDGTITINVDLEKITITAAGDAKTIVVGQTLQLTADQSGVTWSSSDEAVAKVDQTGKVSAISFGEVTIKASKQGFNDGSIGLSVIRPEANLMIDLTTGADHYSADGWWELGGGGMFTMQQIVGWSPIAQNMSWGQQEENPETFIGGFGVGDKETVKFTSDKANKAEIVLDIGNSDEVKLSEVMAIKLNETAIDLSAITLEAHAGDWGNTLTFGELSLGEHNLLAAENTLEFTFLAETNIFLNEIHLYAGDAKVALVAPTAKEQIVISAVEVEVIEEQDIQLTASVDGVTWASLDETVATVDQTGKVTGVKMGKVNIRAVKEGMYSAQVEILVNPKPVDGQILIEAESAAELTGEELPSGVMVQKDGGQWGGSEVHSGGAYVMAWNASELTLTYTFNATADATMILSVVGASSAMKSDYSGYEAQALAECFTMKLNDADVDLGEATFPEGGSMMNNPMVEITIGDVNVKAGENTLVIQVSTMPSLDVFKLSVKA